MKKSIFAVGDIVVLKSGGPDMTVKDFGPDLGEDKLIICVWFEGKKAREHAFPTVVLQKAQPPTKSATRRLPV